MPFMTVAAPVGASVNVTGTGFVTPRIVRSPAARQPLPARSKRAA